MDGDAKVKPQKEISRVKGSIKKLEKDKERMYPGLGSATYQAFLAGRIDEANLIEYCRAIQAVDAQIKEAEAKIGELQAFAQQQALLGAQPSAACPQCGSPVLPGMKFCGNCGLAVPQAPVGTACPSCGVPVAPGTRFCGECGAPVPAAAPQPAPSPPAPSAAPPPAPAAAPPAPEPVEQEPAGRRCPNCGAAVDEQDAAFCGECGARIAP